MKDQKKSTPISLAELAKMIDHTVLKADASKEAVLKLCREAAEYEFGAVCVNSCWVDLCVKTLKGSDVKTASVVGFPLGAMSPKAKQSEAADALKHGAKELDMVINIGFLKSGMLDEVTEDIKALADLAHKKDAILKVIIETSLLNDEEKVLACQLAVKAGADYVKTSTGFSTAGATPEDVELMRKTVGSKIGVKASGGIRTYADAMRMIEAGASRIGCSAGAQILKEAREAQG